VAKERRDIPLARLSLETALDAPPRRCEHPGCTCAGEYRAPRSRAALGSYYWFCLEHVRAYNQAWNYFAGMSQDEIEAYQRAAVTWHRPTWRLGERGASAAPRVPLDTFSLFDWEPDQEVRVGDLKPLEPEHRRALGALGLERTATLQDIKMRYKQLVKRFHPDANPGDQEAEERFKTISAAYRYLLTCGYS